MSERFKPSDLKSKEVLKSIFSSQLQELSKLSEEEKAKKNEDLRELIKYYFELANATDEKSFQICNFSLQYLVLCAIALGILLMHFSLVKPAVFSASFSFLAVQILYLLIITIFYESGSRQKNFLSYDFYPAEQNNLVFPRKKKFAFFSLGAFFRSKKPQSAPRAYLEALRSFTRNYWEDDTDQKILNNLDQLFMLQAEYSFANRILVRLKKLRFWSLIASILSAAAVYFFVLCFS